MGMDRGYEQTDRYTATTEEILTFGPRLPGEGGAMAYMDTISDLVLLYRHARSRAQPPLKAAKQVLAAAWQRLPDEAADRLVLFGIKAIREGEVPDSAPAGLEEVIPTEATGRDVMDWRGWVGPHRESLLAIGLIACERVTTHDPYLLRYHSGDAHQARALFFVGWIPSTLVAVVASVAVGVMSADLWLIPVVALAGTILGYLATVLAWVAIGWTEERWRWLGEQWWTAFGILVLGTGPVVATLVAVGVFMIV
jgi:hypothetical protein